MMPLMKLINITPQEAYGRNYFMPLDATLGNHHDFKLREAAFFLFVLHVSFPALLRLSSFYLSFRLPI